MTNENNPGIRLIDANALLRQDDPTYDEEGFRIWYTVDINRAPTVKSQKAMSHGQWVRTEHDVKCEHPATARWYRCSNCKKYNPVNIVFKFCPNCGAQMSGGTLWQEQ